MADPAEAGDGLTVDAAVAETRITGRCLNKASLFYCLIFWLGGKVGILQPRL